MAFRAPTAVEFGLVSIGIGGARGTLNAPTVLNSGFDFRQRLAGKGE